MGPPTSWKASRSPVTTSTSQPASAAAVAMVAITSSASKPGFENCGISRTSATSRINGSWLRNRSGAASRCALYSANSSERKVFSGVSQATAMASGR